MEDHASVLLAVKSGPLRDGLYALLTAVPQVAAVYDADGVSSILVIVSERRPTLAIVDSNLGGGDFWTAVQQIRLRCSQTRCIFLVDDVRQYQEAEAADADAVLLKGSPAAQLVAAIVRLLPKGAT